LRVTRRGLQNIGAEHAAMDKMECATLYNRRRSRPWFCASAGESSRRANPGAGATMHADTDAKDLASAP